MREIKFRAWDDEKQKMIPLSIYQCLHYKEDFGLRNPEDYENQGWIDDELGEQKWPLMQYTGLKANGKEIYEGDIVRQARCRCDDCARFGEYRIFSIDKFDYLNGNTMVARSEAIEVIGNIYENPELLVPKGKGHRLLRPRG